MTLLKSLVVALALANVGYFLWSRGVAHPQEAGAEAPATTLKLTSEVPASERGAPPAPALVDPEIRSGAAGIIGAGGGTAPGGAGPGSAAPTVAAPSAGSATLLTNVKRCISVG